MRHEKIVGIGSLDGGDFDSITIEGISKCKNPVTTRQMSVEGVFTSRGPIQADEFLCEGYTKSYENIKTHLADIQGMLELKNASLESDEVKCEGCIISNQEINADIIDIYGNCSVASMYGDVIHIKKGQSNANPVDLLKKPLSKLYFVRNLDTHYALVDHIECTHLIASRLKSKTVHADKVTLSNHCIIDKLFCEGEIIMDSTCTIGEIIGNNEIKTIKPEVVIKEEKEEAETMVNGTLVLRVLEFFRDGKINAEEAEKMLLTLGVKPEECKEEHVELPWEDDGKIRLVAYIGRKLLKKGDPEEKEITVTYDGEAANIECQGNLICGDVKGSISAGGNVDASDIDGNVTCGGNMTCQDIGGNAFAAGNIKQ